MLLLVPGERRDGKQKQYYLSNYKHIINAKSSRKKNKDAEVLSWSFISAYGRLQLEHLGTIFQVYPKGLPDNGDYTRFEGHCYRNNYNKRLSEAISDIVVVDGVSNERLPFVTTEDLLKKVSERTAYAKDDNKDYDISSL